MQHQGWISIDRRIMEHWIMQDAEKFKAWVLILLSVNHSSKEIAVGNKVFDCNRGESLKSLESWAYLFGKNWDKSKVRRFFLTLETSHMIKTKNEFKTTRLTVCNYNTYQNKHHGINSGLLQKENANASDATPNNNVNNENNENKYSPYFENFWKKYLRKGVKTVAYEKWKILSKEDQVNAIEAIKPYFIKTPETTYRKNAENFLEQRVFESVLDKEESENKSMRTLSKDW
jgi:hypothetical protein